MSNAERQPDTSQQAAEETSPPGDGVLLKRFARGRDEAAFAEIVCRHASLVKGVCHRVLGNSQDVEDAFQAAFLVLSRDAGKIRKRQSLASWLYGVAHRIALRARAQRFQRREETLQEDLMGQTNPLAELADRHEREAVDEELNKLPPKYRDPLVLHYLMGRSSREVAEELRLSISATEGRLRRGREKLRDRLARRGIGMAAVLAAIHAVQSTCEAAASQSLITSTVQAGVAFSGSGQHEALVSESAARLAGKEISTMSISSTATVTTAAVIALSIGISGHSAVSREVLGDESIAVRAQSEPVRKAGDSTPQIPVVAVTERKLAKQPRGAHAVPKRDNPVDMAKLTREELRIHVKLASEIEFQFDKASLAEVIRFFSRKLNINVVLDGPGLRDLNLDSNMKLVSLSGKGLTSKSALNLILNPLKLGYVVRDEVLLITPLAKIARSAGNAQARADKPLFIDYKRRSKSAIRIEDELVKSSEVDFVDTELKAAIVQLSDLHNIPILFDRTAIAAEGIKLDSEVTLNVKGPTLRSILGLILEPMDLDFVIRNEVMQITTKNAADAYVDTWVYEIGHLKKFEAESLEKLIRKSIRPDSWRITAADHATAKRPSTRSANIVNVNETLVVTQSQRGHDEIRDLLEQLWHASTMSRRGGKRR